MLLMHANSREDIDEAFAGDIVALAGIKETTTGDTLCAKNAPIILERMEFPDPVIELSVEPKTKADQEKMGVALNRLAAEDPSFRVSTDHESGQTIIKGMGELHLDILVDRMKREFKVEANVGAPQVAYREMPRASAVDVDYTHKKQSGGSGQFGRVKVRVTPGERGQGVIFNDDDQGRQHPARIYPVGREGHARDRPRAATWSASRSSTSSIELIDGAYHDVDSSALAFEIAGRGAMREVAAEGRHQAARADHEGRGRDPRGISRRRHRRSQPPPRPDPGHRQPRQCPGRSRRSCRSPTCSATSTNCARSRQGRAQYTMQFSPL